MINVKLYRYFSNILIPFNTYAQIYTECAKTIAIPSVYWFFYEFRVVFSVIEILLEAIFQSICAIVLY